MHLFPVFLLYQACTSVVLFSLLAITLLHFQWTHSSPNILAAESVFEGENSILGCHIVVLILFFQFPSSKHLPFSPPQVLQNLGKDQYSPQSLEQVSTRIAKALEKVRGQDKQKRIQQLSFFYVA